MIEKYGYLGPKGTYSEEALFIYLESGKTNSKTVPYPSIEQVLSAIGKGEISHGIVPLENSSEGTVNLALDFIANDRRLNIIGEVILPIKHNLLTKPGMREEEIELVVSHPQALAQCRKYLSRHFPGVPVSEVNSTAEAAEIAAKRENNIAAIGNIRAAENYGLQIIKYDIQDCQENRTRFVVVSKEQVPVSGLVKTSLVISITDRPGGLYQILKEFALANINLTKIESRPAKRNLGDYLFFIDLLGHSGEPAVRNCLAAIEDMAASFRVMGTYPVWKDTGEDRTEGNSETLSLEEIRQDIDIIDYQIVELLAKRTQLVSMIGTLKERRSSIRDREREGEVLKRARENAGRKGVDPELIEKIYKMLFDHFVELQERQQTV